MQEEFKPNILKLEIIFLTFFGVGLFPWMPGTICTLATLPFLYVLGKFQVPWYLVLLFVAIMAIIASILADRVQKRYSIHDPSWIVIDEVLGMTLAWLFALSTDIYDLALLFILFRFFDITKIWPASFFDKRVHHGYGIILDDLVSGVYSGLVYLIIKKVL